MSEELDKRASDTEREQVVVRLRDASAEGRLTLEELADRTALAYRASSHAELEPLTADLPAASPPSRRKPARWLGVVIGDVRRAGRWRIGEKTHVVMGIGDCDLDLRNAELESDEVTLTISQIIGDATIVVPRHVDVELSGFFLIGAKSLDDAEEEPPPFAPRIHVRAFGLIGEVKVVRR
jgi:DUF1707 SHOCT-like domain/Cell wall-active antibiotics response LiaF, C-terminal